MNYEKYLEIINCKINFKLLEGENDIYNLNDILEYVCANAEKIMDKSKNEDSGIYEYLISKYMEEIWVSELMPPYKIGKETEEFSFSIIENNKIDENSRLSKVERSELMNLFESIKYLFGKDFKSPRNDKLNVELIMKVHKILMVDLLQEEQRGAFRKKLVRPSNSTLDSYCLPKKIESRLITLIKYINDKLSVCDNVINALKIGTLFFSEFLLIHPFVDGNGRCARLLINYILKDYLLIPFSLYYKNRDLYINVLESRNNYMEPPNELAGYILQCVRKTLNTAEFLLMD